MMKNPLKLLPLLMFAVITLMTALSCSTDEPNGKRPNNNGKDPTPVDTTHQGTNDTTGNKPADTTTFTITLNVPSHYGYKGQTMQLTATTSKPATITWRSSDTKVASVDGNGKVTFNNIVNDGTTIITATANGVSDTVTLTNRYWTVAGWDGKAWTIPAFFMVKQGDTITTTIVDSDVKLINDNGFNGKSCEWTFTNYNADSGPDIITPLPATSGTGEGQQRWAIASSAPPGSIVVIMAKYGDAASSLPCYVTR